MGDWLYDLHNWQFCVLMVAACIVFSLAGLVATRPLMRHLQLGTAHNQIVSYFLSTVGVFYGITLGLITVGAWQAHTEAEQRVSREAAALGALYRDVSCFNEPERTQLRVMLREYADFVIEQAWPLQRKGQTPTGANDIMSRVQTALIAVEPRSPGEHVVQGQAFSQFNHLIEHRRLRLQAVESVMPGTVWVVLILGAAVTLSFNWLFRAENLKAHAVLCTLVSVVVGLLMFLTAVMDHPFRGEMGIGSGPFELIRDQLMQQ